MTVYYYRLKSVRYSHFFIETKTNIQRASHREVEELQTNDGHSHVGGIDELFSRLNRVPS